MESLSVKHLISATHIASPIRYPRKSMRTKKIDPQIGRFRFVIYSRKTDFQDFQGYAKPSRLLPATKVKLARESSLKKLIASFNTDGSQCLYKVKLLTSKSYGSGLTDMNAGILLCLIDENGDSILQRIPASNIQDHPGLSDDEVVSDMIHFQRGSVDEFMFEGPKLGKIEALWISLESGQWRLGGVSVTSISLFQSQSEENGEKRVRFGGFIYDFKVEDDILLGEGTDISMAELRPLTVAEFSGDNTTLNENLSQSTQSDTSILSNKESMKEYTYLKLSLLFYDAILVLAGSSIASFSGENSAFAFLIGGIGGFSYLLFLQRSIDGLPISTNKMESSDQFFGRFRGPVLTLVLASAFALIAMKFGFLGGGKTELTPKELVLGMMGFLMCKVAVVLAAFKPIPVEFNENNASGQRWLPAGDERTAVAPALAGQWWRVGDSGRRLEVAEKFSTGW